MQVAAHVPSASLSCVPAAQLEQSAPSYPPVQVQVAAPDVSSQLPWPEQVLAVQLTAGEQIIAHSARYHLHTWQWYDDYLAGQDIQSLLAQPLLLDGRLAGMVLFERTGEQYNWQLDNIVLGVEAERRLHGTDAVEEELHGRMAAKLAEQAGAHRPARRCRSGNFTSARAAIAPSNRP